MLERTLITLAGLAVLALALAMGRWALRRWQWRGARSAGAHPNGRPTVFYFTTPHCVVCRTAQEPQLRQLKERWPWVSIVTIDALAEPEKARHYRVLTVPTTVVVDRRGRVVAVNNGLAPAERLAEQLGLRNGAGG